MRTATASVTTAANAAAAAHRPAAAVRSTGAVSALAVAFGLVVLVLSDGSTRAALLVLVSCLATVAVPVAIRVWGGRAPDDDALFVRVLVPLALYLLPMAVFQAQFGA